MKKKTQYLVVQSQGRGRDWERQFVRKEWEWACVQLWWSRSKVNNEVLLLLPLFTHGPS